LKAAALFTDYDGTIAPMGVPREESRVSEPLRSRLERLSARIPVALVTSKDLAFVRPRTAFATAWACAMGMEIALADGRHRVMDCANGVSSSMSEVEDLAARGFVVEKKMASDGRMLGLSIDWSEGPRVSRREAASLVSMLKGFGLYASHYEGETFVDAFCAKADKGKALVTLRRMLGVEGAVIYLGDSARDNDAFDLAEGPVGVSHGQGTKGLRCLFMVEDRDVAALLDGLLERDLEFPVHAPELRTGGTLR